VPSDDVDRAGGRDPDRSLLWLTLALGMPVGIAYGVWTACGVALVAVIARFLFREPLTWLMVLGIALIVGGVLTIEVAGAGH
jgi:small multidrug resistance pump